MKTETKLAGASTIRQNVTLYASVEMGSTGWLLTSQSSNGGKEQRTKVPANDWRALLQALERLSRRIGATAVACCYEAGRDGFWPYRALQAAGVRAAVLDPASVPVNQRRRRTKTDRTDGQRELDVWMAICEGRRTTGRLVVVPSEAQEDARQLSRTRGRLSKERTRLIGYIKSALARVGAQLAPLNPTCWRQRLAEVRTWDGKPLPRNLMRDLELAHERLMLLEQQLSTIEQELRTGMAAQAGDSKQCSRRTRQAIEDWTTQANWAEQRMAQQMAQLCRLKGIGTAIAATMCAEVFWREFKNRRQVGGYLGLGATEVSSGAERRELGISKAGNCRARSTMVEAAWLWLHHQPQSALAQWFSKRAPKGKSAARRRVSIVAVARKLTIALRHYLNDGIIPQGALLKS